MKEKNIRNFSIIAHIDHGKSTLSDRILELTKTVDERKMKEQMLDSLDVERERGITVKSAAVTLKYQAGDNREYILNLIDTPGHVDFNYEVSRSLAACEGALLIIDATQGVEAQTVANFYLAMESELTILPVINKIDLASADVAGVKHQIEKDLGLPGDDVVALSAKTGRGVDRLLEKLVHFIPPPARGGDKLKALIFDSFFDVYRGAVILVRIFSGSVKPGDKVKLFFDNKIYQVEETGLLGVEKRKTTFLESGEVGYLILGIKSVSEVEIGDTVTLACDPVARPLPGYKQVKPMVFAGIFPANADDYNNLKTSLEKLKLNDSSLVYQPENSAALGFGFRCGFLGLLHLDVVQQRLKDEFNAAVILTAPSVQYRVYAHGSGSYVIVDNPALLPDPASIEKITEPLVRASIITPAAYLGAVIQLVQDRRGIQRAVHYLDGERLEAVFDIPLAEIIFVFYDKLKSVSKGYASLDYTIKDYQEADIVKVSILVNKEPVDALSFLVHRDKARERSKEILFKLKEEIPRHMFAIPLQAAAGGTVIARETISARRKDVTAKCYGGDITRKRKLLEKQKAGKKKMKAVGSVDIPQQAFVNILKN
ncbi:MAG TPA: translation elongation factor 4 [Spirochaetota bacterium]|nr:translation elongation factor 4 [Spirochaetota bacterium]